MGINQCRVCNHAFFESPLLRLKNMPKAAQHLPDADSLEKDRGVDLEVCQCSGCGLVQLSNDPVPYYREVIRAAAFSEEMKEFRMEQFGSFIAEYALQGKKIIEIGCGCGEYLSLMRQSGGEAYGLEYSEESASYCLSNGLKVSQGFIETSNGRLDYAPFDGFYILNFLEHLPHPNALLRGIYKNLMDDAVGMVEVPNFDMILRNKLFSEFIGDHLLYFTKETLDITLRSNGFEIIECNELWYDYILSALVKKKPQTDLSNFDNYRAQLKIDLEDYIRRFEPRKVAIWGAGHQALAIISLMNLADKVRYVVDSASFKQGKYTPASHVPIVSPEALNSDPVDAVIIMAASYSDEVAKIVRQNFDKKIHVSIVRDYGLECL
jgi:2-polyprenyl-3-methyl-5-hydroxy-6-metoxy-1,4-benzoquinol methylase